jgi:hypothetical protein
MPRTSHLDRTQRDSKSSRLLAHRGEAAFVGIGAATQYDRVARLAMEYGIGLSAACQEQYHDEQKTSRHAPLSLRTRVMIRTVPLATRWIDVAAGEGPVS